jgi:hypothetical protein
MSAAAVAAAAMTASTVTAGVRAGSAIPAMGPVMTLGGRGSASAGRACVGVRGAFPRIGATALVAAGAEQEDEQWPEREADKENDFESGFHRIGPKRIFAPVGRGGQDESGEQI